MNGCFSIGDVVIPKTPAGVELADVATNGEYKQDLKTVCVFCGNGIVRDMKDCVIDYDIWDSFIEEEEEKYNIGKINYTSYLVECSAGVGWVGMGAIIPENNL